MRRILLLASLTLIPALAFAQARETTPRPREVQQPTSSPAAPPNIERIGENLYRLGTIRVDTGRKEISVPGTVNPDVTTLEFIANARAGVKAYETALTLDTDATTFNTALILIGLNKSRSRNVPTAHFDPATPEGDEVEISIECPGRECQRMPAERLMYDKQTNAAAPDGTWIYTGSAFLPDGRYLAQMDGTLVGFVHDPASIIEFAAGAGLNKYGSIVLNPNIGLSPGTPVVLTLRAVRTATTR
jgi:hypothetical protein